MDSAFALLKGEINKTQEAEHDLAKWKIAVVAVLGAAALAVGKEANLNKAWLLLFVPFVCAYIDLYSYQYSLRILVIAKFLREYPKGDDDVLRDYEIECADLRKSKKTFSLGSRAGTAASVVLSAIWPAFYVIQRSEGVGLAKALSSLNLREYLWVLIVWLVGVTLIISLRIYYGVKAKRICKEEEEPRDVASQNAPNKTVPPQGAGPKPAQGSERD